MGKLIVVVDRVSILLDIQDYLHSKIMLKTSCHDWDFPWFPSVLLDKCWDGISHHFQFIILWSFLKAGLDKGVGQSDSCPGCWTV